MRKPHLSVSQLNMLSRCPKQWEFRYVHGRRNPPGVAAIVGKGTHGANELDLTEKMLTGTLLPDADVQEAAADETRKAWEAEEPLLDEDEKRIGWEKVRGQAIDRAVRLTSLYHREIAPAVQPVALEQGFRIETPLSHDVIGYVDVREPHRIRDTKTSGKSPSADAADKSLQLTCYHLDAALRGESVALCLDYLVDTARPKTVTLQTERTQADHVDFLARVEVATRQIAAGIFPPCAPDSWCCSAKWCGYWADCPHGARQAVTVGLVDPARLTSRIETRRAG